MCTKCSIHKTPKREWYLEEANYVLEHLVESREMAGRLDFLARFQGDRKGFYINVMEDAVLKMLFANGMKSDSSVPASVKERLKLEFYREFEFYHGAQAVPLEHALAVVERPQRMYLFNCVCKQIYDGADRATCLCFNTLGDVMDQYPDYQVNKFGNNLVSLDRAKELLRKETAGGSVLCLYYYIKPYIGALCSCRLPFCPNLKDRIWGGREGALDKGVLIARLHRGKCDNCAQRRCLEFCQFGALHSDDSEAVHLDHAKCFGCGLCRQGCSNDAIELEPRDDEACCEVADKQA